MIGIKKLEMKETYLFELIQCYRCISPTWPNVKVRFVSLLRVIGVLNILLVMIFRNTSIL